MNWLTNFIRPKIRSIVEQKEVPDNLWQKCVSCEGMLFHRDLSDNMNVCYHCGHHMKITVTERLEMLFDDGQYKKLPLPKVPYDPLKFKDRKKYSDRIRDSRNKTRRQDGLLIGEGTIGGMNAVMAAFDFSFMGGSMGAAIGEGIIAAAESAIRQKAAFILIPSSGGARMQEGMISLMQMPRTIIAVEMVKEAGLPYIVILTDPTTGGVSASCAMVGDIHIAESGCTICFAGKRVITETIREDLPEGFQTAEYLLEHGMIDMVTPRKEMRDTLIRILDLIFNKTKEKKAGKRKEKEKEKENKTLGGKKGKAGKKKNKGAARISLKMTKKAERKAERKTKTKTKSAANINQPRSEKTAKQS